MLNHRQILQQALEVSTRQTVLLPSDPHSRDPLHWLDSHSPLLTDYYLDHSLVYYLAKPKSKGNYKQVGAP